MSKNILFINTSFPIDCSESGGSVRSIMLIESLCDCGNVDVIDFCSSGAVAVKNCNLIYTEKSNCGFSQNWSRWEKIKKLLTFWNPYSYYPKDVRKEKIVDSFIQKNNYDLIVVRYLYQACECGLLKYGKKIIIDIDDNPSEVFKSESRLIGRKPKKLYLFIQSHLINIAISKVRKSSYHLFYSNIEQSNKKNTSYLHNVTLMKEDGNLDEYFTLPNRILMVGNFWYYPNTLGLKHFMKIIFPIIKKEKPDVALWLVGKMPPELREKYQEDKAVTVFGFVDNIADIYKQIKVTVIPIYLGAGTCVKVIESIQMKRPCVTTQYGVRGFNRFLKPNEDYLLAMSDLDFAHKVIRLLDNSSEGLQIASHAYDTFVGNFSTSKFKDIVKQTIRNRML